MSVCIASSAKKKPAKYKQNFNIAPHGKISADAHGKGFGAIVTKVCQ